MVSPPVSPPRLTFIPDNWDTPQTVTLIAPHDDDVDDEKGITITHVVDGSDYGANSENVDMMSLSTSMTTTRRASPFLPPG